MRILRILGGVARKGRPGGAVSLVLCAGVMLVGCAGSSPSKGSADATTPLAAARSWFTSVNDKDLQGAEAHFVRSAKEMTDWENGDTSTWPTFTDLSCKTLRQTVTAATVYCSFEESASPAEGNPDNFWTVSLQRTSSGHWLINNYGQG